MKFTLFTLTLLVLFIDIQSQSPECLAPASETSSYTPNSDYAINSWFKFDYIFRSTISGRWKDDQDSPSRERFYGVEYYVNSADGSLFFPGEILENVMYAESY